MAKIKVVVVDDHRLMVEAVRMALELDGDFDVVGWTTDAVTAPNLIADLKPEIAMVDLLMPVLDGLTLISRIKQRTPDVRVVVLSASDDQALAQHALQGGAHAFVYKHVDPRDLGGILRQVLTGPVSMTFGLPTTGSPAPAETGGAAVALSERELQVLKPLADGYSNAEIGEQLFLAEQTVKYHLSNVYRKLGARNRTDAVRLAVQAGLVANPVFKSNSSD
jgi:DNA-binding NarL/FixJ family response regulator